MTFFKVLLVGFGGGLGSMVRYISVKTIDGRLNALFPFGTLFVNLLGSFPICWKRAALVSLLRATCGRVL